LHQRRPSRWTLKGRRPPRIGGVALVLAALVGFACGRPGLDHPGHGDGGPAGASAAGGQSGGAGAPGGVAGAPGLGGATGKIPCQQITDAITCSMRADCRSDGCTDFVRCASPDDPRLPCPVPADANPCSTTHGPFLPYCVGPAPWCHPIYSEMPPPEVCPPPLDCAMLVGCGDNGTARCVGSTGTRCGRDPPSCASGYMAAIDSSGCYEGCVPLFYCDS
jgi:hypothetical protein